jgi:hypothetical protein
MAKVYRVLKLRRESGKEKMFQVVSNTEWGSELGKARADLGDMLQNIEENCVVSIETVEAPATREEFVEWLNRHEVSPKPYIPGFNDFMEGAGFSEETFSPEI